MLNRIAETGAIFWAQSDREWTLDGAAVQVSMVGFDDGSETNRELDGLEVSEIFTNLRSGETDVTKARRLAENLGISFMGDTKGGPFDISESQAKAVPVQPKPGWQTKLRRGAPLDQRIGHNPTLSGHADSRFSARDFYGRGSPVRGTLRVRSR